MTAVPLGAVAAFGLPGAPTGAIELDATLLRDLTVERQTGTAWAAVEAGRLDGPADLLDELAARHARALTVTLVLDRLLVRMHALLVAAGVPVRLLKGPALARQVYPAVEWRTWGDVDLLVPTEAFAQARSALAATGLRPSFDEPRPGFDARFGKGTCYLTPGGLGIDLHRSFAAGAFGLLLSVAELWTDGGTCEIAGVSVATLDPESQLLHAAFHAVLGDARPWLTPRRDLAQLAQVADVGTAIERAERWHAGAVLARAVRSARSELRVGTHPLLDEWSDRRVESRRERSRLAAYEGTARSYARQVVSGVRALPVRDRAAFAGSLLFPTRAYLAQREMSYWRRAGRAARLTRKDRE